MALLPSTGPSILPSPRKPWRCLLVLCGAVPGPPKGLWDFRRVRCGVSVMTLWRRWDSLISALRARASVAASRLISAGAIPARTGSWLVGVARRHPETVRSAVLRAASSFLAWGLRLQTGAQYSAVENTKASVEMRSVFVEAPHVVLARRRINAARAVVFPLALFRCCLKDSVRSSFTPRYVGEDWDCRRESLTMMLILRVASLL